MLEIKFSRKLAHFNNIGAEKILRKFDIGVYEIARRTLKMSPHRLVKSNKGIFNGKSFRYSQMQLDKLSVHEIGFIFIYANIKSTSGEHYGVCYSMVSSDSRKM